MTTKVPTGRERQEQAREQLLDAAATVFARRGYHEACVEGIASEAGGEAAAEAGRRDWPLLFYELWSFGVRKARIRGEFAKRRQAVRDALAETLDRLAAQLGFELRFPSPMLATAISAALNGLAFERAADPGALSDEVLGEFVAAILGCSIAVSEHR